MEECEEIADSLSSETLSVSEAPLMLENMVQIRWNEEVGPELQFNIPESETESLPDSEETHISDGSHGVPSPIIPRQDAFGLLQTSNLNEQTSNSNVVIFPIRSIEPHAPIISPHHQPPSSPAEPLCANYPAVKSDIAQIEDRIKSLDEEISKNDCCPSDSQIAAKEKTIKELINVIALNNKKEKEGLIELKKKGTKVKSRLKELAECQRKLVSLVKQQTELSQKIKEYRERQRRDGEDLSLVECSQSLLQNSATQESENNECQPPVPKFPSILKKKRDVTEQYVPVHKKVVQFQIPSAEDKSSQHGLNSNVVFEDEPDPDRMCGNPLAKLSQFETGIDSVCTPEAMEVAGCHVVGKNIDPNVPVSSCSPALDIQNTCLEKSISAAQNLTYGQDQEQMDFDELSNDSSSLISGVSGFAIRPLALDFSQASEATRLASEPYRNRFNVVLRPTYSAEATQPTYSSVRSKKSGKLLERNSNHPPLNSDQLLSMSHLIQLQLLKPGPNVIQCVVQGRSYKASLLKNGFLEGAERMVFQSPMVWMKALTGLKQVTKTRAYKTISYNGQKLYEICQAALNKSEQASSTTSVLLKKQFPQKCSMPSSCSPSYMEVQQSFSQPLLGKQNQEPEFLQRFSSAHRHSVCNDVMTDFAAPMPSDLRVDVASTLPSSWPSVQTKPGAPYKVITHNLLPPYAPKQVSPCQPDDVTAHSISCTKCPEETRSCTPDLAVTSSFQLKKPSKRANSSLQHNAVARRFTSPNLMGFPSHDGVAASESCPSSLPNQMNHFQPQSVFTSSFSTSSPRKLTNVSVLNNALASGPQPYLHNATTTVLSLVDDDMSTTAGSQPVQQNDETQRLPLTGSTPKSPSTTQTKSTEQETVLLVQDDELFPIRDVFPGFDWRNGRIPKNLDDYFL